MLMFITSFVPPRSDRRAVTALEYGLIAGVLVAVILAGFTVLGDQLSERFTDVASDLT